MKILKLLLFEIMRLFAFFRRDGMRVAVLMYHSVSDADWPFAVTPEEFEKQIAYLSKHSFKFIDSGGLMDIILGRRSCEKGVLITFDDGYKDFISNAIPVLEKYKAPAVIFFHTDRSSDQLKNSIPLMDWEDIKNLDKKYEIGSHSRSHPVLKKLSTEELESEVKESAATIEKETGAKAVLFAYPFGLFTDQTIEILKDSGYKMAFTTDRGLIKIGDDPFRIKRFGIKKDTSFAEFKARLTPASDWYEIIVKSLK